MKNLDLYEMIRPHFHYCLSFVHYCEDHSYSHPRFVIMITTVIIVTLIFYGISNLVCNHSRDEQNQKTC